MLNISHLHFLKVLKASSAPFLTETEGTGLKRSLIPCALEVDRKGWCFILRTRDSSSIWHLGTHMWFAVSQSQPTASESAFCPSCSRLRQAPSTSTAAEMSHVWYMGLQGPPQPHREASAAPANTSARILLRRQRDGAGGDRNGF